ncbi:replication initiation protein [Psychrobacter raelei]|uniref:replication initiation protein n=1 Tax=Psychrobacter raelei TaxID=2565531 RepID=UPI003F5F5D70
MDNQFLEGFREKIEALEDTDPLQKANFDLLQLVSEAMIGKVSGQEYELRMLEIKTRIAILERQEAKGQQVLPSSFINEKHPIRPSEKKVSPVYGDKWFVIQNRLLNAITDLELNERRLIIFLSPLVRKAVEADPTQRIFTVRVKDFVDEYGLKGKYLYKELETIADSILEKVFFFWYDYKGNQTKKGVSWVSECDYIENEGLVKIKLDDTVIEMLTVFDKANPFTKYERKMIANLGSYGVILFELIASCMHQQHKQKAYTVEYLRAKFNCVDTYSVISEFKRNVLNKAINDIEIHTPYRISYTQNKKGRIIHEIVFSFEDTREKAVKDSKGKNKGLERAPDTADMFTNYTDKQLARAVHSKKFIADYNGLIAAQNPANQSSGAWISHMVEWVKKDPECFTKRPVQEYLDDEQAPKF